MKELSEQEVLDIELEVFDNKSSEMEDIKERLGKTEEFCELMRAKFNIS